MCKIKHVYTPTHRADLENMNTHDDGQVVDTSAATAVHGGQIIFSFHLETETVKTQAPKNTTTSFRTELNITSSI